MGIYPSSGETVLTEESSVGTNFLAQLQCDGEAATASASTAGIRVVNLRIPPVVGSPKLKRGTGRLGNGLQWTSWVSLDELASIVEHVLMTGTLVGPLNPASPNPVRNTEFSATSSRVLGVKAGLPIPAFVLRLMMGEIADALLLASRRIEPQKLLASGYRFLYPKLEDALRHGLEGQII
jgi:NAD dependent epimerase/dehydratase family enzyme